MRSTLRDQAEHLAGGSIFGMTTEQADGYQRLVGEVEARNTQTRQAMTEAERRAALPTSTEDVPASEQYRAEDLVDLRHKNGAATDALVARELAKVRNTTERSGLTHTDDPIRLSLSDIEGARSSINASMKLTPKEVSRAVKLYGTDAISRKLDDLIVRAKPRGMRAVLLPEDKEMLAKIAEENPELRKPSPYRPVAIDREGLIEDYGGPTYTQDDLDKVSGQITEAMEAMGGSGKLDAQEASFMVSDFASQGIGNEFGIDRMHPEAFEKFAANHSQLVDEYRRALDYLQYAQNKGAGLARSINVLGRGRAVDGGERRSQAGENAPNLALRNPRTGEPVEAQAVASLKDMLGRFSPVRDPNADPLARASALAIGSRLGKLVGDTPVFTVGPAEMRTLVEGRMRLQPGYEPAGFYDPRSGHIVALDDALRDPREAGQLMLHEGTHGFTMRAIEESPAARDLVDTIRQAALDAHQAAGGDSADHYGLANAHEFVAEGFSAPEFQRFLASIPASDAIVKAFDLDGPGHSLWDVLVAAVRKILGLAPDQHTLLDATMRLGKILEDERADLLRAEDEHIAGLPKEISHAVDGGAAQDSLEAAARSGGESPATTAGDAAGASADGRPVGGGSGGAAGDIGTAGVGAAVGSSPGDAAGLDDLKPILRFAEAERREDAAKIAAARAKAFADAKSAIAYRINSDRIEQHPKGPLAGFLGILTRDIHEKGGINVEAVQQVYQDRIGAIAEKLTEAYGSKWAGLKQDVAGMRDVIREVFGVDTKNQTAKAVGEAWRAADTYATGEAKRLGKVFTPAEDWRVPQFWESSRAQKFGKGALLADLDREITSGGLRVFDPDTHEEANPLRLRAILDGVADKIVTDASLGGTHGGAFKTDMRVFRFADGAAGADSYLRLMDKYGAGRGGYLAMMQAHIGKVSRELGLARVLGPNWSEVGEKLLQDAQLANKKIVANTPPRDAMQRVKDLPKDTGKFLTSWLESPAKADAVWQHMSGQASGVGSELMAGLLAETRSFMTATRMGSALVTAVPADSVNFMMAAKHNGMDMGRLVSGVAQAFVHDTPELREEAARLGIATHSGMDAALGTKRFEDQFVGEKVFKRMAETVIRLQGLHAWDSAIKRVFVQEFLGTIAQRAGKAFEDLDEPFANFVDRYGLKGDWQELSDPAHMLDTGEAKYLHPDNLPEALRVKLMSAIYDERQFAYLAGGSERVRATSASAKAGTLPGELARSVFLFKSFPMTMLSTWGMRAAREAGAGRIGTLATLVTGMTFAGALAMQARSILQGKDPRKMDDPYFWAESFLQGGAAGIYGDFFKEAFSRSDTSLTESLMGPLAAIPAGIQGLTSGARRAAEDGEHVNFGGKVARLLSQNVPGGNLWYARLGVSRLIMDNIQRVIDPDYNRSFARQQQRALKTNQQGFYWAPGQNTPSRAPDLGASLQ